MVSSTGFNASNLDLVQQSINASNKQISQSLQRIATGIKLNSASDGAAELSQAVNLTKNLNGNDAASSGLQDANNVLNIADGGLSTINDSLQRARELTVQASSDTLSSSQRAAINTELTQIGQTIDQVSKTTSFNGKNLLDGSQTSFNVPTDGNAQTSTNIAPGLADASTGGLGVSFNVSNSTTAQATLASIDSALQKIGDQRSFIGASQNGISSAVENLSSNSENLTASLSRLQSTDIASEFTNLNGAKLQQAGGIQLLRFSQNAARSLSELIA